MLEIYFQDTLDAKKVYSSLCDYKQKGKFQTIILSYDNANLITGKCQNGSQALLKSLFIPVLTNFILKMKEDQWMLAIIANFFYYSDYVEQQQIVSVAHSISDGEIRGIPEIQKLNSRRHYIEQALDNFLKDTISFSFESFIKFRLKEYNEILFRLVEIAIDEYKMEQEYQSFIQALREILQERESKIPYLYVLHQNQAFRFYKDDYTEITHDEMKLLLDRKLIIQQPIYIDSSTIAPLVSIAPKMIHLYTDDVDDNMIQTILTIFQERVTLFPKQDFNHLRKIK